MFKKIVIKIVIFPIRIYQLIIRPLVPNSCVFHAHGNLSCSHYAIVIIKRKGVVQGVGYALWRIMRCNPWTKTFTDPL